MAGTPGGKDGTSLPRWLSLRLRALRAFSLPVSVLPVLVATAAVRPIRQWDWPVLTASAIGVALLHAAGNLLNDYFDFRHGVDRAVAGDDRRPGRLLVRGDLRPRDVLAEALACLLLAAAVTAYLLWRRGAAIGYLALATVAGLYSYTGPPLRLKYRAMGEVLIFLLFGPGLMLGAAFAQTGKAEWALLPLSSAVGCATTGILVGNNIRDHKEEAAAGVRTLAHLAGAGPARVLYVLLEAGAVVALAVLASAGLAPRVLVLAPLALLLLIGPLRAVWRGQRLADIDAQTARFQTVLLCGILAAYLLDPPG